MSDWISVEDRLPEEKFGEVLVAVSRSHWPTSSYDIVDAPYDETLVMPAMYDSQQKIWYLDCDEHLNELIDIQDAPLNGDYVTHWMPMPEPPKEEDHEQVDKHQEKEAH